MDSSTFIHNLTSNQFSNVSVEDLLKKLAQLIPNTNKLLRMNQERYAAVPEVKAELIESNNPDDSLQTLCNIFPTLPFVVASQLKSKEQYAQIGQQFQIAVIGSMIAQYDTQHRHIDHFINQIDHNVDVLQSSFKSGDKSPQTYLPKIVKGDLILIAKGFQWKPSRTPKERVETYYCMEGLSQILLRYYFDLLAAAETIETALYLDTIFLNFFINLRYQEQQYWKAYFDERKAKVKILAMNANDSSSPTHPILKNLFFSKIKALHPVVHDGRPRKMPEKMQKLFYQQLKTVRAWPSWKKGLFVRVLNNSKGLGFSKEFLTQVTKTNPAHLKELQKFLKSFENADLPLSKQVSEQLPEQVPDSTESGTKDSTSSPKESRPQKKLHQKNELVLELSEHEKERDRIYKEALAIELHIDDDPKHVATVERFLTLPVSLNEKLRYLNAHTPDPIPIKYYRVVEEVQKFDSISSPNPVAIYKGSTVLMKGLIRLLFEDESTKPLSQQNIIPILADKKQPLMNMEDFFAFPFAKNRKGPEPGKHFEQHLYYLKLALEEERIKPSDYEKIMENIENLPVRTYKKYYNIIRKNKLDETTFMAIYSIWQNGGLQRFIDSQ